MANAQLDLTKEPPEMNPVATQEEAHAPATDPSHAAVTPQPAHGGVALAEQLLIMKKEIDLLQIQVAKPDTPWWRQVSTLVAVGALLLSLASTVYSEWQRNSEEVHETRAELRQLLVALDEADLKLREIEVQYRDDPATLQLARSQMITRKSILSNQAVAALRIIGDGVTGPEYMAVGIAVASYNEADPRVIDLYERGLGAADVDKGNEINLQRSLAYAHFVAGDLPAGRAAYEAALAAEEEYVASVVNLNHARTHMFWAAAELRAGQCSSAQEQFRLGSASLAQHAAGGGAVPTDYAAERTNMQRSLEQRC